MDRKSHWETIHREKPADAVSWYRPHLDVSLRLIEEVAPDRSAAILDVGAGQSTLVDDLLERGYERITVLDIAQAAIDGSRKRVGARGHVVRWQVGDVRTIELQPAACNVWHDRAVFHFLTAAADRAAYVRQAGRALKPGGHLILGAFAVMGPGKCSGLDVVRYDAATLEKEFGSGFRLVKTVEEEHRTPSGVTQPFLYGCFRIESP
ncbi:MAG TPA: class I SAM-dependent methyltransferase [Acidobacteriaceae bacterium]|nr:class I SAM-dependent methyltransferase [Acidobacteriaceae bacterium]